MTHDFGASLAKSHAASDLPIWREIYSKAFPGGVMVDHRQDGEHQRAGIDRSIVMPNAKQILVDEKVRFGDWDDIALEHWSNYERRVPGWVCKPLRADYIAYAFAKKGKCYLLPVPQLQQAWERHGDRWRTTHRERSSPNVGYTTKFVPVPVDEVFRAIGQQLRVDFSPVGPEPEEAAI